jgi:hypothetical protein
VVGVHVGPGQQVTKGDPLYTLHSADGQRGIMRAPITGCIVEGPVSVDSAFATPLPVVGIEETADAPDEAKPTRDPTPGYVSGNATATMGFGSRDASSVSFTSRDPTSTSAQTRSTPPTEKPAAKPYVARSADPSTHRSPHSSQPGSGQPEKAFMAALSSRAGHAGKYSLSEFSSQITGYLEGQGYSHDEASRMASDPRVAQTWRNSRARYGTQKVSNGAPGKSAFDRLRALLVLLLFILGPLAYLYLRANGVDPVIMRDDQALKTFGLAAAAMGTAVFVISPAKSEGILKLLFVSAAVSAGLLFPMNFVPASWLSGLKNPSIARLFVETTQLGEHTSDETVAPLPAQAATDDSKLQSADKALAGSARKPVEIYHAQVVHRGNLERNLCPVLRRNGDRAIRNVECTLVDQRQVYIIQSHCHDNTAGISRIKFDHVAAVYRFTSRNRSRDGDLRRYLEEGRPHVGTSPQGLMGNAVAQLAGIQTSVIVRFGEPAKKLQVYWDDLEAMRRALERVGCVRDDVNERNMRPLRGYELQ